MIDKILVRILFLILSSTLVSCSTVMQKMVGLKRFKYVNEKEIYSLENKYHIPKEDGYELDTSYFTFLFSLDSSKNKAQIKNHYQPLQALYYDKNGNLISFQINCYAGGFPNLKWDRDSIFSTFVPKQQAPLDSLVPLELLLKQIKPLSKTRNFSIDNYDFVVIVFWNRLIGRQADSIFATPWIA